MVFAVSPASFGSAALWSEMQCSGRLAERPKAGRSHVYCCRLAPGGASRCILLCLRRQATPRADIAVSCPCEASRANNFLAGRSLAAILFCRTPERDQREPERSEGSSRARSGATRFPLATCGTRPVSSGLVSFRPSERNDSAPPSLAVAAVKWSGRKAAESGQAAGGTGSALEARHELKR